MFIIQFSAFPHKIVIKKITGNKITNPIPNRYWQERTANPQYNFSLKRNIFYETLQELNAKRIQSNWIPSSQYNKHCKRDTKDSKIQQCSGRKYVLVRSGMDATVLFGAEKKSGRVNNESHNNSLYFGWL